MRTITSRVLAAAGVASVVTGGAVFGAAGTASAATTCSVSIDRGDPTYFPDGRPSIEATTTYGPTTTFGRATVRCTSQPSYVTTTMRLWLDGRVVATKTTRTATPIAQLGFAYPATVSATCVKGGTYQVSATVTVVDGGTINELGTTYSSLLPSYGCLPENVVI